MPGKSNVVLVVLTALCLGGGAEALEAQAPQASRERSHWFIGYSTKPPQQLLGGGVAALLTSSRRWGFVADGRISTDRPQSRFIRDAVEAGTWFSGSERDVWANVNAALLRAVSSDLSLYLGAGASWQVTRYRQYERWVEGQPVDMYWVESGSSQEVKGNLVVGGLFRVGSRLATQFGWQTAPEGFTVGGYFRVY